MNLEEWNELVRGGESDRVVQEIDRPTERGRKNRLRSSSMGIEGGSVNSGFDEVAVKSLMSVADDPKAAIIF